MDVPAVEIEMAPYAFCRVAESASKWNTNDTNSAALPPQPEEKPRKKRKTQTQIYEEEHPRGSEADEFNYIHNWVDKGPKGSSTHDRFGFELDYNKCFQWGKHTYRSDLNPTSGKIKRQEERWVQDEKYLNRIAELMGDKINTSNILHKTFKEEAYKEKVRKDLGQQIYQVSVHTVENWHNKGFRAEPREFDLENIGLEKRKMYND